ISTLERIDRAKPGSVKGWAMDHCDLIDPKDVPRAAKLGLMWSCNLMSVVDPEVPAAFGDKAAQTYANPIKSMIDAGINVSLEAEAGGGTIWGNVGILVTRKGKNGKVSGTNPRSGHSTAGRKYA